MKSRQDIINEITFSRTYPYYPEILQDMEKICKEIVSTLSKEFGCEYGEYGEYEKTRGPFIDKWMTYEVSKGGTLGPWGEIALCLLKPRFHVYSQRYLAREILKEGSKEEIIELFRKIKLEDNNNEK